MFSEEKFKNLFVFEDLATIDFSTDKKEADKMLHIFLS
jgi:hypothetical protein